MNKAHKILLGAGIGLAIAITIPLFAIELHNLELVAEITEPDTISQPSAFGLGLASGDVNGDGYSDIIVSGGIFTGYRCICIYYGGSTFHSTSIPDVTILHGSDPGYALQVGDVNGDGYDDVVSCPHIWYGGNPVDTIPDWALDLSQSELSPERGTPICGDLNGDGYDDFVFGAPFNDVVDIFYGGTVVDSDTIPDVRLTGCGNFGEHIASGYDVNNDGYDDLIIAALRQGKVYIYYGGNPMDTIPDVIISGPVSGEWLGEAIALLPDVNNDSYNDVCIGNPFNTFHDRAYSYWGGNPMNNTADMIFSDSGTYYGYSVSGVKKVLPHKENVLEVGACGYHLVYPICKGKVYIYLGGNSLDTVIEAYAIGADNIEIGWRVADAGDVNGDGCNEIMFSNYASPKTHKVWVCKYTGPGIEEKSNIKNQNVKMEILKNPFYGKTVIRYSLSGYSDKNAQLTIYDLSGRVVKTFPINQSPNNSMTNNPITSIVWNGTNNQGKMVSAGTYVIKLKVKDGDINVEKTAKCSFLGQRR